MQLEPRMIRALIFDFDGLIVNTESPAFQSWQETYAAYGQELHFEQWVLSVGTYGQSERVAELQRLVGYALDTGAIEAQRNARHLPLVEAQPILPGVVDRIADAQRLGLKLGLASSSPRDWVEGHLARRGLLHHFDALCTRDDPDVGVAKPDPAVYLAALRALGVAAHEAIALEDSPNGVQAATRAGIFTVAIPNDVTRRMGDACSDLKLDSLADMTLEQMIQAAEQAHAAPG